jgi:hypothetical protein
MHTHTHTHTYTHNSPQNTAPHAKKKTYRGLIYFNPETNHMQCAEQRLFSAADGRHTVDYFPTASSKTDIRQHC